MPEYAISYKTPSGTKVRTKTITSEESADEVKAGLSDLHAALKTSGRPDYMRVLDVAEVPAPLAS